MDKEKYEIQKIQFVHNLSLVRLYDQYFDFLAQKNDLDSATNDGNEAQPNEQLD